MRFGLSHLRQFQRLVIESWALKKRCITSMPKMRDLIAISFLTALISLLTQAQTRNPYHPFASQAEYDEKVDSLNGFIARFGKRRINRIFVAKVKNDDGKEYLYGYWEEDNSILFIDHFARFYGNGKDTTDYEWLHRKARVDLRTGVVPTKEDIGASTFLVDKPWADRVVKACLTKGRKVLIHR
jgi:hypothetical protein